MKKILFSLALLLLIFAIGQTYHIFPSVNWNKYFPKIDSKNTSLFPKTENQTIVYQESVVTQVVEQSLPSVVTVGITKTTSTPGFLEIDPFNPFGGFRQTPGQKQKVDQNIGSGFIVKDDGIIITNKHVVADTDATYKVVTNNDKTYNVEKIYRDPLNDLAILKVNASGLKSLLLGDSNKLKLGQMAIAIGTPLGEFRNTVTTGIISGLGRGITAGSPYEGYVEKLDNVIQTDAAISPGNSGGPLLNSKGEVIGVNAAIAQGGSNIGFAIPVNVVKNLLSNFDKRGGSFERPYLGIRYRTLDRKTAVMNNLAEGAYVESVVVSSPAAKAGIQEEDVIVQIDNQKVASGDKQDLATIVADMKVGQKITIKLWRNGEIKQFELTLEAAP